MPKNYKWLFFFMMVVILRVAAFGSDWPIYKGNPYFTGNNDEIIVKNNYLKWLFQASNYVYYPVVSDGKVYFADIDKVIYCVDEEKGTLVWKFDMKQTSARFLGASRAPGKIKYPLIKGAYLFLSDATAIYCINKTNGSVVWARAGLQEAQSNVAVIDGIYADPLISENTLFYGTRSRFIAREISQGHVVWSKDGIGSMSGFPTFYDRFIFAQSRDYKKNTFAAVCMESSTGKEVWSTRLEVPVQIFSPVVYRERVYIPVNKKLYCLDLRTGRVLWDREYADLLTSSPSFTEDDILFTVGNRNLSVVDPQNGAVRHEVDFGERSGPYFVTVRDQVYVASGVTKSVSGKPMTFGVLQAYRFGEKDPFWRFDPPFPGGPSQPAASRGVLFLPAGNYVYAVGAFYDRNVVFGGSGNSSQPSENTNAAGFPTNAIAFLPPTNTATLTEPRDKPKAADTDMLDLEQVSKGQSVVAENIYFEFNQAYLRPESIFALDDLVLQLKKNPKIRLEVQGHTDNIGAKEYNKKLSERRADSVMNYLIKNGISPERLRSKGFGMEKPVASNDTEQGRSKNRRTEILILDK